MKKTVSQTALILSGLAVLAAIWAPGPWWQWLLTALLLFLVGGATHEAEPSPNALADAWDAGWHEHYLEWERQREDPRHPITANNPHRRQS